MALDANDYIKNLQSQVGPKPVSFDGAATSDDYLQSLKARVGERDRLAEEEAPNNLERFLADTVQKVPFLQRVLHTVGQPGSAVSNILSAGVAGVQGEGDLAMQRLGSAMKNVGEFATLGFADITDGDDLRMFTDVLKQMGVGKIFEADLPVIGKVSGRGMLGLVGDIATDPLRFGRLGGLTKAGTRAAKASVPKIGPRALAEAPVSAAGKVGSPMAAQAKAGQRAMLGFRVPFTDNTVPLIKGARALAAVDSSKQWLAGTSLGRIFGTRGKGIVEGMAEKGGVRGSMQRIKETEKMQALWGRFKEMGDELGMPAEDIMEKFALAGEKGKDTLLRDLRRRAAEGFEDAPKQIGRIKELYEFYRGMRLNRREAWHAAKVATMYDVSPVMAPIAAKFAERMRSGFLLDELDMGVSITALGDEALYYMTRVITPEARHAIAKAGKTGDFMEKMRQWSAKHEFTHRRNTIYEGKAIPEINAWMSEQFPNLKGKFFDPNPQVWADARSKAYRRAVQTHDIFTDTVDGYGRPKTEATTGPDWVDSGDLARTLGLRFTRPIGKTGVRGETSLAKYGKTVVPKELADEITRMMDRWKAPDAVQGIIKGYDTFTRWFKTGVTVPFPAFHARNWMSAAWANYLADMSNPAMYAQASSLMDDLAKGGKRMWKFGDDLEMSTNEIFQVLEDNHAVRVGFLREHKNMPLLDRRGKRTRLRKITDYVEDHPRIALFLDRMHKGYTPDNATLAIKKHHFDYTDLSPTEKSIFRRVLPFYTWSRKNLPLQLESLVTKPGKVATLKHFQDWLQQDGSDAPVDNTMVPEWVRRRLYGAKNEGDTLRIIGGGQLGFEDLANLEQPGQEFLSMMNPLIKGAMQAVTGKEFFRNVPLNRAEIAPPLFKWFAHIPGGQSLLDAMDYRPVTEPNGDVKFYRANPRILNAISSLPAASAGTRGTAVFGKVLEDLTTERDPSQPNPYLQYGLGPRVTTIPREQQIRNNLSLLTQKLIDRLEQLDREGITAPLRDKYYIRRENLIADDPRTAEAREIQKRLRMLYKARKELSDEKVTSLQRSALRSGGQ